MLGAAATVAALLASIAVAACGDEQGNNVTSRHEPRDSSIGTAGTGPSEGPRERRPAASLASRATHRELAHEKALGQLLVGRFSGRNPSAAFLARIRAGELGGVILFADNAEAGDRSTRETIRRLQSAAVDSGNPPLLVLVDQEGGGIKRLPGPPTLAPSEIESTRQATNQGTLTGRYLRGLGINVDLAPVVDVPAAGSFIRERAFGTDPRAVAKRACAFSRGLLSQGVAPTLKHFPGLGRAQSNTDSGAATVGAPAAALRRDYAPYRTCGSNPRTLTMLSSASYRALTGALPAVVTAAIYSEELPRAGVRGLRISDDLEAPALAAVRSPAADALAAGLNLALHAKTEEGSAAAHSILARQLEQGTLSGQLLMRRARPVLAFKALLEPGLTESFLLADARRGER